MSDVPLHIHAHHFRISSLLYNSFCVPRKSAEDGCFVTLIQLSTSPTYIQPFPLRFESISKCLVSSSSIQRREADYGREVFGTFYMKPQAVFALVCHMLQVLMTILSWTYSRCELIFNNEDEFLGQDFLVKRDHCHCSLVVHNNQTRKVKGIIQMMLPEKVLSRLPTSNAQDLQNPLDSHLFSRQT